MSQKNQTSSSDSEPLEVKLGQNVFAHKKSISFSGLIAIKILNGILLLLIIVPIEISFPSLSDRSEIFHFVQFSTMGIILFCFLNKIGINFKEVLFKWRKHIKPYILSAIRWFLIYLGMFIALTGLITAVCFLLSKTGFLSLEMFDALYEGSEAQRRQNYMTVLLNSSPRFLLYLFSVCILGPIVEEVFYRRLLYVKLRQIMRFVPALFISSIIFGVVHLSGAIQAGLAGLFLGFIYEKEQKLPVNILVHGFMNLLMTLIRIFYWLK